MDKADKKASNLRLTLLDATSHERLWSLRFSRTHFIIANISLVVVVFLAIFCLIAFTPIRTFIPGYPNAQSRRQAVQNAQRIDSLQTRILQWELYTENLRRVVAGEDPIRLDTLMLGREGSRTVSYARYLAIRDSLLRADVVQEEQFGLSSARRRNLPIEAMAFYTPVKGVVSKGFDRSLHPWVDVTAPVGSPVMAVLDGSVVYTSWSQDNGYTLVLQHGSDLLSIYKNNQKLLHKTGDVVKAGTPVAMLASSNSLTKGDHLHFELWYKGVAVDPAQYIKF